METGFLTVASLDDIVFEGRNKAYGAYVLRQEYPRQVIKATGISLVAVFMFLTWSVAFGPDVPLPENKASLGKKEKTHTLQPQPYIPRPEPLKPPAPEAAAATPAVAAKAFRKIKTVSDLTPVVNDIPRQTEFDQADPGLITATGEIASMAAPEADADIGLANGSGTEISIPFEVVEKMPEFPDGQSAMYKFINKHLRYPPEAQSQGLEGNVILTFVVSASGEISDIKILRDIGGGAGEEARRVVAKMPRWQPGIQQHRAVPVRFTLPIRFRMH